MNERLVRPTEWERGIASLLPVMIFMAIVFVANGCHPAYIICAMVAAFILSTMVISHAIHYGEQAVRFRDMAKSLHDEKSVKTVHGIDTRIPPRGGSSTAPIIPPQGGTGAIRARL